MLFILADFRTYSSAASLADKRMEVESFSEARIFCKAPGSDMI
jgi:hypothetical protein